METEIAVAIIGLVGSVTTALIGSRRAASRERHASRPQPGTGRPALVFAAVLAVGLALTAILFAYTATGSQAPRQLQEGTTYENESRRSSFVTLFCNATLNSKTMGVEIGGAGDSLELIASESGKDRLSSSVIVPAGWFYRIEVTKVDGLGCGFREWPL